MSADDGMNPDDRVQLTRIEGTVNLVSDRLGTLKEDVLDLKRQHGGLHNRVTNLETESAHKAGERQGIVGSGRLLLALMGGSALGVIGLLWKAFGV